VELVGVALDPADAVEDLPGGEVGDPAPGPPDDDVPQATISTQRLTVGRVNFHNGMRVIMFLRVCVRGSLYMLVGIFIG
jgi:hypothetical protein